MLNETLRSSERKDILRRTSALMKKNRDCLNDSHGQQFFCECGNKKCSSEIYGRYFARTPGRWAVGIIHELAPSDVILSKENESDEDSIARLINYRGSQQTLDALLDAEDLDVAISGLDLLADISDSTEQLREADVLAAISHSASKMPNHGSRQVLQTQESIFGKPTL